MLTLDYELIDYTATEDVNMREIGKITFLYYIKSYSLLQKVQ